MLNPILERWRFFALLASATMLAAAHAFQTFGGLAPCELCLKQRAVYWVAGAIAAARERLPHGLIGLSAHSVEEAHDAADAGAGSRRQAGPGRRRTGQWLTVP